MTFYICRYSNTGRKTVRKIETLVEKIAEVRKISLKNWETKKTSYYYNENGFRGRKSNCTLLFTGLKK